MRILLIGEPSNLHWTLAQGLRSLGYTIVTVSDGNKWKKCNTDILLLRGSYSFWDSCKYLFQVFSVFSKLRGYDVVQLPNPLFLDLKPFWNRLFFFWLRTMNEKIFLGAFGDDFFWIRKCISDNPFKYSNFLINGNYQNNVQNNQLKNKWFSPSYRDLNILMAGQCNGIVNCLYEYYASYKDDYKNKIIFIPLPINLAEIEVKKNKFDGIVRFFIGVDKERAEWKGSDVLYSALLKIYAKYPTICTITKVESVPYHKYIELLENSDVLLDQLYSYTPAMNALLAMARGLIVVGGGEAENYEILGEDDLRPIINVLPSEEDVFDKLEWLIQNMEAIPRLSAQSVEYVRKHHNYIDVANKYVDFWSCH